MLRKRTFSFACSLIVGLSLACASGGAGGGRGEGGTGGGGAGGAMSGTGGGGGGGRSGPSGSVVRVANLGAGNSVLTIYMSPDVGVETLLGTVEPGRTVGFPWTGDPGRYRIHALGAGTEVTSDSFRMPRNAEAYWDMSMGKHVTVSTHR